MDDKERRVDIHELLKGLDLSLADSRAGRGALLRELHDHLNASLSGASASGGRSADTTIYNAGEMAGLDHDR